MYAAASRTCLAKKRCLACWNTPLPPRVWNLRRRGVRRSVGDGRLNKSLKLKLGFRKPKHCRADWNKRRRAAVSTGMGRQACRPTSNANPLQRVYRLALTLHST
jgi:hypothetical protein